MKTKQISISEYTRDYKKVSAAAIRKAIDKKKPHLLPYVITAEKIGRNYVLTIRA